ncbi:MAG: hypothetical protein R3279_11555 [Putridiphycobacter sp.]|nr:hypothetical protein [Putridiphycobacter sp.]
MKLLFTLTLLFLSAALYGQTEQDTINYNDSLITITGKVIDTTKRLSFYDVMVINKTVGKGIFGSYDGSFSITVKKGDQIAVSTEGYKTQYFSFKNSTYKKTYVITVYLEMLSVTGKVVEVKPLKTLQELQEERAAIQKREVPQVTGVEIFQSPITALYMQFSKREKTKRMIAELEFKDEQKAVVKEILRVYVNNDIIDLEDEQFDAFITFLNLNDNFLKVATDYELIVYIKYKYEHFTSLNRDGF